MIQWKRIEAGTYTSENERFLIYKTWDRIYGNHWVLHDKNEPNYYHGKYDERTLLDCKLKAEAILSKEEKHGTIHD